MSDKESAQDEEAHQRIISKLNSQKPPPEAARLESVLYQLTQADDVEAFIRRRGINLVDGRLQVIIKLREGAELVADPGVQIESSYGNLLRALIPIDQLLLVSQQEGVLFVRLPHRPAADDGLQFSE